MDYEDKARLFSMSPLAMVKEFATVTEQKPDASLYETLISEEYDEWFDAGEVEDGLTIDDTDYDPAEELKELADLVYVCYGYANAKGWDLDEAIRRVHINNLGRCRQPDGTIQRREDGKILKNKDYPKVVLEDLTNA